jgi:hypothetical protein
MPLNIIMDATFFIAAGGALFAVIALIWLALTERRISRLLGGSNKKSIEDTMLRVHEDFSDFKSFRTELETYLETVEGRLKASVQSVGSVRFNPFKGTGDGGNQSFSTAFVNEHGDGVVLSGLYSRDRISVFSKALVNFSSEYELTEEEQDAISLAKEKLWKNTQHKNIRQ